ncbi:MAG: polysaccharide biosynthesis C-terminal domain-containing protein [Chitinophagales bacterium]|nr:polysaccharide biosynthesis C-terminal domain-containing protein [Chitinophagales bacterium]
MSSIVKQSSLGLVANYFGILLGFLNVMIIMPYILLPEQIGLINLIFSVITLVYPVLDLSALHIMNRYFTHVKDKQEIFNFSFILALVGAMLFLLLFALFKPVFVHYYQENSPLILPYYWWIYVVSVLFSWATLIEYFAIIHGKYHVTVFFKEVLIRVGVFVLLGAYAMHLFSFNFYVYLYYTIYAIIGFLILVYLRWNHLFDFKFRWPIFSLQQKKNISKFGALTILSGLASVIAIRIDMIMLGSMDGLKGVGVYTIALFMATIIEIPKRVILSSSAPIIRSFMKNHEMDKVFQIHYKTILNLMIISGFIFVILASNIHSIYAVIPNGHLYIGGTAVVLFLGLSKLIEMLAGSNDEIILASRFYIVNLVFIVILMVLAVSLNYFLIPKYGLPGAALATLICSITIVIIKFLVFKRLFNHIVYDRNILKVILFYIFLGVCLFFIPEIFHPIFSIILKGIIGSIALYFFLKSTQISKDLIELVNDNLTRFHFPQWLRL